MNLVSIFGSKPAALLALVFMVFSQSALAQGKDMKDAVEAKRLVDETNAFEKKERAELAKKIKSERARAIESLKRLAKKYRDKGERSEARAILKLVNKLEKKHGGADNVAEAEPEPESDILEYNKEYVFKSDKIEGRITFMTNGNANMIYKHDGTPHNVVWNYEEKSDHILISNGGDLGRIYVSDVPKSEKRSIMIRIGRGGEGKLRHHVFTATRG